MNQKHLLRFIKSKMKRSPDELVCIRDGQALTLNEVFESLGFSAYELSIDTMDMHVSRLVRGFDSGTRTRRVELTSLFVFRSLRLMETTTVSPSLPRLELDFTDHFDLLLLRIRQVQLEGELIEVESVSRVESRADFLLFLPLFSTTRRALLDFERSSSRPTTTLKVDTSLS